MGPEVLTLAVDVARECDRARAEGRVVGLVPTMGALHDGHLALIDEARRRTDFLVVTIFVNPLQFGPGEDFDRYPRTLDSDLERCRKHGVDVVFCPTRQEIYGEGFQTHVEVEGITNGLEGAHRPGHFRGVTTIVAKLLCITAPCVAVFGRKDYQQWKVLERMVRDLNLRAEVVAHRTVREPDGLALSSRNRYLSAEERSRALAIARGFERAHESFAAGERRAEHLRLLVSDAVHEDFDRVDYVTALDPESLEPAAESVAERLLLAVAAHVGHTRLIDNTVLGEDEPPRLTRLATSG